MMITDYIESIGKQWQHEHPELRLETLYAKDKDTPQLVVDDTFRQALISLLNNAADAGATHISLELSWDHTNLHIRVMDNGSGLPANIRHTLGTPFVSTKADGQGLGFYLAQAVISRMGGHIRIQNREQGNGAYVHIQLPLQPIRAEHE